MASNRMNTKRRNAAGKFIGGHGKTRLWWHMDSQVFYDDREYRRKIKAIIARRTFSDEELDELLVLNNEFQIWG